MKPQPAIPPPREFQITANSRLEQLRELCQAHGAKLIILLPPTPSSEDTIREMTIAAQRARVDTLVPIDPAALSVRYYQPDELHLNSEGAQLFTTALATFLPQTLDHELVASPN
jgi:lysophospholipase L1-like esterase